MDINELRRKRKGMVTHETNLNEQIKDLDRQMRSKRGELDKTRKEIRNLTSQITKLAKDEEEL